MTLEVKEVNKILKNLFNGNLITVHSQTSGDWGDEKSQGDYGTNEIVYTTGIKDLFIKVIERDDSYGSNEKIVSVQFVQPQTKPVTVYEEIK